MITTSSTVAMTMINVNILCCVSVNPMNSASLFHSITVESMFISAPGIRKNHSPTPFRAGCLRANFQAVPTKEKGEEIAKKYAE